MSPDQLAFYSGWASILGLAVSLLSLAYVRSIKANIIKYQRKQRLRFLIDEIEGICMLPPLPWRPEEQAKLNALKRHLPPRPRAKQRLLIDLHSLLANGSRAALIEALKDLRTFSEGL
ncbi:hypothetical protein [Pseudoduganella aquatica]|uniref:Uncharacterized protein n=1 Tax=Pseudoduganella aquatica TaxID=2660641 RepID=A0A7X4HDU9_9BURK|nr:hypothetical protein [Pseudoduganella aquatica]MYN08737.1 hypothetical protein [Pseudoduganella aquatica]